jgi:hypothetical protein
MGSGLVPELTPKMCTREMRFFLKKQKQKKVKKVKKKNGEKSWIATAARVSTKGNTQSSKKAAKLLP